MTDARGNTTDYTYDSAHGGVLTVTRPAPTGGATRSQTRTTYAGREAYFRNGASSWAYSPWTAYLPTEVSACVSGTAPSCLGGANEARRTISYGPTGAANNLLPVSITRNDGSSSLAATTATTYDRIGDMATVDGPLPGSDDTTTFRYDVLRRQVGVISPDPDGGGSMLRRAQRSTYASTGLVSQVDQGTVTGTSDSAWAAFATLQSVALTYDANRRLQRQSLLSSSAAVQGVRDLSYDTLGRPLCATNRMNPAAWSTLTAACTLQSTGSDGPDRISRTLYNAAGEATQVQTAYGTSDQATVATSTYTGNGRLETLTDGEGNKTTYVYDGHDRLSRTRFPSTTQGSGTSSTTDYEELTYDAGGNVTNRRLRDSTNIAFTFDALNRITLKNLPGSELDVTYTYDQLNRMLSAYTSAQTLSFTFDALGRNLTQVGPQGTTSYQYDLAGRRTRLTYPGSGLYVDYDYLLTNDLTTIRENGATSGIGVLATYAYDNLGRRTSLTRGNGTSASFSFDDASRLSQLVENMNGTTYDLTLGFSYNPSAQIISNTRSNDNYAYTARVNGGTTDPINGLNQVTATGSTSISYGDARGNITAIGSGSYGYSSENMLVTAPSSATLAYDPLLRLYEVVGGGTTTRYAYDGADMTAEYNSSSSLQRRFVHGPGVDEPIVWYEGTGTSDRRWLHADERGSIVAISNDSGNVTSVNSYDEYGIPAASNAGRFQYTGQAWIPEIVLYYYRARFYNPAVGRFMQTDPIGFGGGMNLYAYVGGDPVNLNDPSGLCFMTFTQIWQVFRAGGGREIDRVNFQFFNCDGFFGGGPINFGSDISQGGSGGNEGTGTEPEIVVTYQRRRLTPNVCQTSFAGATLSNQGLRSYDLTGIEFREGLDDTANIFSRGALNTQGTSAVTQYSTIFVDPSRWSDVTDPNGSTFWEEIFHTVQFSILGRSFYAAYGAASAEAAARGRAPYDNSIERQAQDWAQNMSSRYQVERPCAR